MLRAEGGEEGISIDGAASQSGLSCAHALGPTHLQPLHPGWPRRRPTVLSAAAGKGQGQLSYSYDLGASSPACLRRQGASGHLSLIHDKAWQTRGGACSPMLALRPACPRLNHQDQLYCVPRAGAGPALPNAAEGEEQGQVSCLHDPRGRSLTCYRWQRRREGEGIPGPCHHTPHSSPMLITLRQAHQQLLKYGGALFCWLGGRFSLPALTVPCIGEEWG